MKIALLHYRYVPAIAGVELILEQHAWLFADEGHEVTILCGSGASNVEAHPRIRLVILPALTTDYPLRLAAQSELDNHAPGSQFQALVDEAEATLRPWLQGADRVIVHNVLTMPFHLACTAALWKLADELPSARFINWVHDLAAVNPDYDIPVDQWPWTLPRKRHPAMRTVAISKLRAEQFEELTGSTVNAVIPNGIDPLGLLNLTPQVAQFATEQHLLEADVVLLQPARILRRKNIELGLHFMAALREHSLRTGDDFTARLLVTGAPDGHNPASDAYHAELLTLRDTLGLHREVLFINEFFPVAKADLVSLYGLCDVLWFPSKQEGFGLPVLEGALHRLLIFCADVPPMNTFSPSSAEFFDPASKPEKIAEQFLAFLVKNHHFMHARRDVVSRYAWEAVWPQIRDFVAQ